MSYEAFDGGEDPTLRGITHRSVALARLPKVINLFRIAQLSDIHISHFMTTNEIRRCVTMTNRLKPDLVLLTGDFVSWDSAAAFSLMEKEICIVSNS
jgi:predicted MPP superfamily phosphohydrolase